MHHAHASPSATVPRDPKDAPPPAHRHRRRFCFLNQNAGTP